MGFLCRLNVEVLFEGNNQQDCQEFLNYILNEINDKILKDNKWDASNISPQLRNQKVSRRIVIKYAGIRNHFIADKYVACSPNFTIFKLSSLAIF